MFLFRVRVTLGEYNLEVTTRDCVDRGDKTICAPTPLTILADKIATYPKFNRFSLHHDVAIIQLSQTVQFNGKRVVVWL